MQLWKLMAVAAAALSAVAIGCGDEDTGGGGGSATGTTPSGSGGTTSTGSGSGGSECTASCLNEGFICCGTTCVNPNNDIFNCGDCNTPCAGDHPYCDNGTCGTPPDCSGSASCTGAQFCCGGQCCEDGELCCSVPGPVATGPECVDPTGTDGTCPDGCTSCVCASPDTPIATPTGERPIAELRQGDLVYSMHHGRLMAVPILRINRTPAERHRVVQVGLATGRILEISAAHPTADGRSFGDLKLAGKLDGERIMHHAVVPYRHDSTYDILPASDSGTYVAAGALIGSTLAR